jgi:hypothetical protein
LAHFVVLSSSLCSSAPGRQHGHQKKFRENIKYSMHDRIRRSEVGRQPISASLISSNARGAVAIPPTFSRPTDGKGEKHRPFAHEGGLCCRVCLQRARTKDSIRCF